MSVTYSESLWASLGVYLRGNLLEILPLRPSLKRNVYKIRIQRKYLCHPLFKALREFVRPYQEQYYVICKLGGVFVKGAFSINALRFLDLPEKEARIFVDHSNLETYGLVRTEDLLVEIVKSGTYGAFVAVYQYYLSLSVPKQRERCLVKCFVAALERECLPLLKGILLSHQTVDFWEWAFKEVKSEPEEVSPFSPSKRKAVSKAFYVWFYSQASLNILEGGSCLWTDLSDLTLPTAYYESRTTIDVKGIEYPLALKTLRQSITEGKFELFKLIYSKIRQKGPEGFYITYISLPTKFLEYLGEEDQFKALDVDKQIDLIVGRNRLERLEILLKYASTRERVVRVFSLALVSEANNFISVRALKKKYGDQLHNDDWDNLTKHHLKKKIFTRQFLDFFRMKPAIAGTKEEIIQFLNYFPTDPTDIESKFICRLSMCQWTLKETREILYRYRGARYFYRILCIFLNWSENPKDAIFTKAIEHAFLQSLKEGDSHAANIYRTRYNAPLGIITKEVAQEAHKKGVVFEDLPNFLKERGGLEEDEMDLEVLDWWD